MKNIFNRFKKKNSSLKNKVNELVVFDRFERKKEASISLHEKINA